jgi:HSP20 family protein
MTLVRWEPKTSLSPWRDFFHTNRMNRWFDNFFDGNGDEDATIIRWRPAVDIEDSDSEFTVAAELPGMTKDDIELTIKDNILTLKGEKKTQTEKKDGEVYLSERCFGSFQRSFNLSNGVDAGKVKAEFKDGILTIHLPKVEEAKPKTVEIAVK